MCVYVGEEEISLEKLKLRNAKEESAGDLSWLSILRMQMLHCIGGGWG